VGAIAPGVPGGGRYPPALMGSSDQDFLWWRDGVVYQIYPRSFADGNGDGVGDLRGIIERLDYLNDGAGGGLGVDAIWLSPIYPSPMHDFGYDIQDYCDIAAEFGTMDDFRELLSEAHRRGIRVVMDLVMNHCSSEHPWFVEARSSRESPKRDWFIWHDGKPGGGPPNNWKAAFGGRAWTWDAHTRQYYLHSFLKEQPDVNWRNPDLARAMHDMMRFWLDLGVDGFRLDVINWFIKDAELRDNPTKAFGLRPYDRHVHLYDRNRPESIDLVRDIRRTVDAYPERMTVGEVFVESPGDPALPARYYAGGEGLHMAFNFAFLYTGWAAEGFAHAVDRWESLLWPGLWPNYTLSNHDQPRAFTRYGEVEGCRGRARLLAAMLLTLRGTPFLYYGEEIGMKNGRIPRARLQDPVGKQYWPFHPGRDPARTPMQWSDAPFAGFSPQEPWLPVNDDYREVNVRAQEQAPDSLLHWYRHLIRLRRAEPALRRGAYRRLVQDHPEVFAYGRELGDQRLLVALNFARRPRAVRLPEGARWERLLSSDPSVPDSLPAGEHPLEPYGVRVVRRVGGAP
jgi:alpha-glucosidase